MSAAGDPFYGLSRADVGLLNRLAFAGAVTGRLAEARAICAATARLAPDHACSVIGEHLCLMAEGAREAALDLLEREGLARARAWEQAAELLLAALDPAAPADRARLARVRARLETTEGGRAVLAAAVPASPTKREARP